MKITHHLTLKRSLTMAFGLCMAITTALSLTACSDDDDPIADEETEETVEEEDTATYHFDIVMTVGRQGGMGRDVTTIVRNVESLEADQDAITITGVGCEINSTYTMETIYKGKYYYQVPVSADRFTKFHVLNNGIVVDQEQKFASGYTYSARNYTHAWLDDTTLLIMASNGDKDGIIWTKLNADDMSIIDNGRLAITLQEGYDTFTTSGIVAYRESDDMLFYFYYNKVAGTTSMNATNEEYFRVAAIDASTMLVQSDETNAAYANEMAGSAYGELLQSTTFSDEDGNLYLAAFNDTDDMEQGVLLRINAGETNFDPDYNGFANADGKLLTVQYLGDDKAFIYSRCDAQGTKIDSYSHYYSLLNISTGKSTRMQYGGTDIAYSSGRFSQRSAIYDGKVYFGVNPSDSNPMVYIYDISTGTVSEGVQIEEGYYFEQIRLIEDYE